jgi:hypothetical protein
MKDQQYQLQQSPHDILVPFQPSIENLNVKKKVFEKNRTLNYKRMIDSYQHDQHQRKKKKG